VALFYKPESLADLERNLQENKQERDAEEERDDQDIDKLEALSKRKHELLRARKQLKSNGTVIPQKPLASTKFDVWSFGVVMYEMLCSRSRQCALLVYSQHHGHSKSATQFFYHVYSIVF
jgi:serine/threonine protein kinase